MILNRRAGYASFEAAAFYGLVAPQGMPPEVVTKLSATRSAHCQPELQDKMKTLAVMPGDTTPARFEAFSRREVSLRGERVRCRNTRPAR